MQKPAEYRRRAEECRKLADGALSGDDRTRLLEMARNWMNLAEDREELLAKHPELDRSGVFARSRDAAQEQPPKLDAGQGAAPLTRRNS